MRVANYDLNFGLDCKLSQLWIFVRLINSGREHKRINNLSSGSVSGGSGGAREPLDFESSEWSS